MKHPIPNLANASALLWHALKDINWVGFYLMQDGQLILGPFQGKPAYTYLSERASAARRSRRTGPRVADVHQFPGHIACDSVQL